MRAVGAGLVLSALFLASCSTAAEPTTLATPTAEAPTTATPTSEPKPSSESQEDEPGLQASEAMDAYFSAANSAARGADLEAFAALFESSCEACQSAYQDFAEAQAKGLRADGDRYGTWVTRLEVAEPDEVVLRTIVDFASVRLVDESGETREEVPAWNGAEFVWTLAPSPDGTWLIVGGRLLG